jgi:surface antigen
MRCPATAAARTWQACTGLLPTRAAGALTAAELRPGDAEIVAQQLEQRLGAVIRHVMAVAVDHDGDTHAADLMASAGKRIGRVDRT